MSDSEPSVAEFYAPVMGGWSVEVQRLVVRLLSRDIKRSSDLEDEILAAAERTAGEDKT